MIRAVHGGRRRRTASIVRVLGVGCILLLAHGDRAQSAGRPTVVVLPGSPPGGTPGARAAEKIAQRVITDQLADLRAFRVVSFAAASHAATAITGSGRRDSGVFQRIGVDLGADLLVVLTVDATRGRWRARSALYNVPAAQLRSGPSGSGSMADIWPVLASITRAAAERAGVTLTADQLQQLQRVPLRDESAVLAVGFALASLPGSPFAEAKVLEAVRRAPEFVEAHMELGRLYFGRQEYDLAANAYEQVRALRPGHPYADYNLGLTYRALGHYSRAIDAYERARLVDDADPDIVNNLGIAYYLHGDLERARDGFRSALTLAPYDRRVHANLRTVEEALRAPLHSAAAPAAPADAAHPTAGIAAVRPPTPARGVVTPAEDPQIYVDTATIYFARGEYERAMVDYERAVQDDPENGRLLMQLGLTYQRLARHADALASFNRVLELDPGHEAAADGLDRALAALRLGQRGATGALAATRTGMNESDLAQTYYRKGKRHFVREEYADAIAAYTRALQFTPNDVAILNSLGVAQFEHGATVNARVSFARVLEVEPYEPTAVANLAALDTAADQEELRAADARDTFTLLRVEVDPALAPEVAYVEGNAAFARGDFPAAAFAYQRAVTLSATHGRAWNNLGATKVHLQQYAHAADAFRRAAALLTDPVVQTNAERVQLLAAYAESTAESRTLVVALEDDPDLDFRYRMARAREAYNRDEYASALQLYEGIAALYLDAALPLNNLAATYFQLGRHEDAYATIELALRRDPTDSAAQANRTLIAEALYVAQVAAAGGDDPLRVPAASIVVEYSRAGPAGAGTGAPQKPADTPARAVTRRGSLVVNPAATEQELLRILHEVPDDGNALRGLAGLWASQGRWAEATDGYRRAAETAPDDFLVSMAWGYAALRAQRADEARPAFVQAAGIRPTSARARYNLAIAERRAGNPTAAIRACRAALVLEPNFADAQYNLANLYLEEGMWSKAAATFQQVLRQDDTNVSAYNNLAIAYWRRGEVDEALGMWRAALAVDPSCQYAADNLNRFSKQAIAAGRT